MSQYGEYNYDDGVRFQSSYENAYTKKVEQPNDSVPFNKMYFDNGIDLPTALQSKLPNNAVVYSDFKVLKVKTGTSQITISAIDWKVDNDHLYNLYTTDTQKTVLGGEKFVKGHLKFTASNQSSQKGYVVTYTFCGITETFTLAAGDSNRSITSVNEYDLTPLLTNNGGTEPVVVTLTLVEGESE